MEPNQKHNGNQQFQHNQRQNFQQRSQQAQHLHSDDYYCRRCGAMVPRFNRFCEECGEPVDINVCPHCNGKLSGRVEICPFCGKPVDTTRCTFCGGVLDPEDNFCCECGNPVHGINCPKCGTLNFRNFCRKCNSPLTQLAQIQLQRVKNDPRVIRAKKIAQELEQLEQQIQELQEEAVVEGVETNGVFEAPRSSLSDEDKKILDTYSSLFGGDVSSSKPVQKKNVTPPKTKTPITASTPNNSTGGYNNSNNNFGGALEAHNQKLEKLQQQYQQKVKEMGTALLDLLPDPQDPPIVQRDFLSACKVVTMETIKTKKRERLGWVCNLCGYQHLMPSECSQPELGGTWVYHDVIKTTIREKEDQIFL